MTRNEKIFISAILITLAVACRLLPHLWNFAPVAAVALFSGVYLGRRYAVANPLLAMLAGDIFIGFYELPLMIAVYASFAAVGLIGCLIKKHKSLETVLAATVTGSVLFFLATNWAVWQFSPWYAKNWAGLISCFTAALPFFRQTLLGDLFYTGVLFGAYEAVRLWASQKKEALAEKFN